jgi:hypothetical protein
MCAERLQQVVSLLSGAGVGTTNGKGAGHGSPGAPSPSSSSSPHSIQLIAIGSGSARVARGVLGEQRLDSSQVLMLVDPARAAYRALALKRGVVRTFTWRKKENAAGAKDFPRQCCVHGRLPMVNAGDPWSQGGVFVYGSGGGRPLYALREESPGWPGIDEPAFVAAVKKAAGVKGGGGWFSTGAAAAAGAGASDAPSG